MALAEFSHHAAPRGQTMARAGEWVRDEVHGRVPEEPTPQEPGTQHFFLDDDSVPELGGSTTGARAESHAGADCGFPCASEQSGSCGGFAFNTTGARTESSLRQTMEEIGDGVQHVCSKGMQERHGDCNIKGLDKNNIPRAGVVSDTIPTGFVIVADLFRPLPHWRTWDVPVKKEIAEVMQVKQGPKRVFVDFGPPHSASMPNTGKVFTVEMPHQHVHQAYPGDSVVFNIKGLDKHNMPRAGDVMVRSLRKSWRGL